MEREMLRAAQTGETDYFHVAIAVVLFIIAGVLYAFGYAGAAAFVAVGFLFEMAAWVFLFDGKRRMFKTEAPSASPSSNKENQERT